MGLSSNKKNILSKIIDKYENSKTYDGTNVVNQSFTVKPDQIWKGYYSDSASVDKVRDFEREVGELEESGLVIVEYSNQGIKSIKGNEENFDEYYRLLNRKSKRELQEEYINYFTSASSGPGYFAEKFAAEQCKRAEEGRKLQYSFGDCREIIRILKYMENNREERLERELSIILFGDSKKFEKTYKSKVLSYLLKTEDGEEICCGITDEKERETAIFENFNIYANPSYIYFKGDGELTFSNGSRMEIKENPVAVSSAQLKMLERINIAGNKIVTVENLTSFHRSGEENTFYIYLAGYHNTAKQQFIKKIAEDNENRRWYHFGDIDPDGFYILENLKEGTGINFEPLYMGINELKEFKKYTKELNKNDIAKAENLLESGLYGEIMIYMLRNNCKLEQEIVSLKKSHII